MAENKKEITITEQVRELVYDVQNKTHLTGQAREYENAKGYDAASYMQASDDADSDYQIRRSIANAFSTLKSQLGEYLVEEKTTSDNLIPEEIDGSTQLTLTFLLPSNFNRASVDSLGNGIHAYLVDMAIAEWFTITNKADAQDYVSHSAVSLEIVRRALYRRSRPERPTYA